MLTRKDPHIYLLSPTAFENQAPNYQIKKLLDKELTNKRVIFESSNQESQTFHTKITSLYNNIDESLTKPIKNYKNDEEIKKNGTSKIFNELHNKNIEEMLNFKVEMDPKRLNSKRERPSGGYLKKNPKSDLSRQPPMKAMQTIEHPHIQKDSRCQTANNFYKSNIFSKTSIEQAHTEFEFNRSSKDKNFIEKNKQLGRVAEINKRRFSKMFVPQDEEKNRILRIKTMKKASVTARSGVKTTKSKGFTTDRDRSKTPAINSYRNFSVNEKRGLNIKNPNAMISKVSINELCDKLNIKDEPMTATTMRQRTDTGFGNSTHNLNNKSHRPKTRQNFLKTKFTGNSMILIHRISIKTK
jgi:hypothetical protein